MKQNSESTFMQKLFSGCIAVVISMSFAVYRINSEFERQRSTPDKTDKTKRLMSDKIYYKIDDYGPSVTVNSYTSSCSGDIIIPSTVEYKGETYSVTSIGCGAFMGCSSLTSISIPSSATSIGNSAFSGCTSLTSISLPESLTSIEYLAFSYYPSLTTVVCRAEKVPHGDKAFANTPIDKATLYVPASSIEAYKAADGWNGFGTILPLEDYMTGAAHLGRPAAR